MNLELEDFLDENRKQIEKHNRKLAILEARLANLSVYAGLLEKKLESSQADIRKAFLLTWLMLILFFAVIYSWG